MCECRVRQDGQDGFDSEQSKQHRVQTLEMKKLLNSFSSVFPSISTWLEITEEPGCLCGSQHD